MCFFFNHMLSAYMNCQTVLFDYSPVIILYCTILQGFSDHCLEQSNSVLNLVYTVSVNCCLYIQYSRLVSELYFIVYSIYVNSVCIQKSGLVNQLYFIVERIKSLKTRLLLLTASIHTDEGVWMNSKSSV